LQKVPAEFIESKFLQLVVPYFFFSSIAYVYWLIVRELGWDPRALTISPETPLNGTILAVRGGDYMVHNGALWFICALFMAEIAFYFIYRLVKKDKVLLLASLITSLIVGTMYVTFINIQLPWSVDTVPIVIIFLGIGYFIGDSYPVWERIKNRKYVVLTSMSVALILSVVCWLFNKTPLGRVDMFFNYYGSIALYIAAAFFGSVACMIFFESLFAKAKVLTYIGRNSLVIYALHQKVIFGIIGLVFIALTHSETIFSSETSWEKLGNGVIYLVLTLLLLAPIVWLLNKYCGSFVGRGGRYVVRGWFKRKYVDEPIALD
jgi:fucose 4-O-acetylase-like acetyltransferase